MMSPALANCRSGPIIRMTLGLDPALASASGPALGPDIGSTTAPGTALRSLSISREPATKALAGSLLARSMAAALRPHSIASLRYWASEMPALPQLIPNPGLTSFAAPAGKEAAAAMQARTIERRIFAPFRPPIAQAAPRPEHLRHPKRNKCFGSPL